VLLQTGVPLHRLTSLRVGGKARRFASPRSADETGSLFSWARREGLPCFILGAGTNVIFLDSGYDGLVIDTRFLTGIRISGTQVTASAGEPLSRIAWLSCRAGLSGLEWGCGIPGTVGGAVAMNAGTREGDTGGVLHEVEGASLSGTVRLRPSDLKLGYRESAILDRSLPVIVTSVTFELERSTPSRTVGLARRLLEERRRRLPQGPSAGCVFKNPQEGPSAGELLDRAGCKGLRVGDAHVSELHVNFIINEGERNASEILELMELMKERVEDEFGIVLEPEIVIGK